MSNAHLLKGIQIIGDIVHNGTAANIVGHKRWQAKEMLAAEQARVAQSAAPAKTITATASR